MESWSHHPEEHDKLEDEKATAQKMAPWNLHKRLEMREVQVERQTGPEDQLALLFRIHHAVLPELFSSYVCEIMSRGKMFHSSSDHLAPSASILIHIKQWKNKLRQQFQFKTSYNAHSH